MIIRPRDSNDPQRRSRRGFAGHRHGDGQSARRVSLLAVASITQSTKAPYYYSPSKNTLYVTQAGAVLSGINFGSATVIIEANNVTIKDCSFSGCTTGSPWPVYQAAAYSGATAGELHVRGLQIADRKQQLDRVHLGITIKDKSFLDSPSDAIDIRSGVVTGNYFSGTAYLTGAHSDAIWVDGSTGPTVITAILDRWNAERRCAGAGE